jgi:hypothetical protein
MSAFGKQHIICFGESWDNSGAHRLGKIVAPAKLTMNTTKIEYLKQVELKCRKAEVTKVICTQQRLLELLVEHYDPENVGNKLSLNDYRGSVFWLGDIQILVLSTLSHLAYMPEVEWLFTRWTAKLTNPKFPVFPEMVWEIVTPHNADVLLARAKEAIMIAVDIETVNKQITAPEHLAGNPKEYRGIWYTKETGRKKDPFIQVAPMITMVGYACLFYDAKTKTFTSETYVLNIRSMVDITYMRMFNLLPAPKIMHNGGYDCSYFIRYNAPVYNYIYDSFVAMHAWVAELSRNLSFTSSLFNRDHIFWKDDGARNQEKYNAKDCHNTLWSMLYLLQSLPEWAWSNYLRTFRMQFPNITCGMDGFLVDQTEMFRLKTERAAKVATNTARLWKLIAPGFNPNSPPQTLLMMHGLGFKQAKDSNDKTVQHFIDSHPLWDVVGGLVKKVRKDRKAISTYFELELFDGRLLYEMGAAGTDTSRFNSKSSNFWCGTQIQNIPPYAKTMCIADEGWELGNCDNSQSESRCTAYLSEDANLIRTVEAKGAD